MVWGKIYAWIDQENYNQLRTEFYDEDGFLVNIMTGKKVKMIGGKLLPTRLEMIPVDKEGHKTIMEYSELVFDQPIKDSFFTAQNMRRVK